jgi:hypothetical protein
MTTSNQAGPAFLSELAENVVLTASILAAPVLGQAKVRDTILNVGSMYASRTAPVLAVVGDKTFIQYDATLVTGETINAITVLTRDTSEQVIEINIGYSPMQPLEVLAKNFAVAFSE